MYDISNVQRKLITADQAERPLESSLPQLLSHCQILLSQEKEFTLQEGWSGNFLCLSSVISPEAVRWMARRTHFTCIWGCQGGSWILRLYIKDRAYPLILGGDSCPRMLSSLDSFAWLPPAVLGQGPEGFPGLCQWWNLIRDFLVTWDGTVCVLATCILSSVCRLFRPFLSFYCFASFRGLLLNKGQKTAASWLAA